MSWLEWNEELRVGIESIDNEHRQLILMLDQLYQDLHDGKPPRELLRKLDEIVTCIGVHFAHEEGYFDKTGYPEPEASKHKKEHVGLTAQIKELQAKYKTEPKVLSENVMAFLKNWLVDHIKGKDKKYAAHLVANGIR